ncbi:Uncharacterised protein [Staphylococcus aureus]|nr:Uncharacterised protein [Staphylococcus aureus]
MPIACTSSKKVKELYSFANSTISTIGAMSPSIEYTDSNTINFGVLISY